MHQLCDPGLNNLSVSISSPVKWGEFHLPPQIAMKINEAKLQCVQAAVGAFNQY